MRLLNTSTFELAFFADDDNVPEYAILSHTWAEEEVTFGSLCEDAAAAALPRAPRHLRGWDKLERSCAAARDLHMAYIWVDTCCIDKSSSAELSEAINSMFWWYQAATVCIAHLADVRALAGDEFEASRWFTRGWTLQELIAPSRLLFYGADWTVLGSRDSIKGRIAKATGLPEALLAHGVASGAGVHLDDFSVAQRMSWAASRVTTRPEDVAYCLLGIFDINMPLLYGEGRAKAFKRLQEEIIKSTEDESLYAWRCKTDSAQGRHFWGLLAESPAAFGNYGTLLPVQSKYLSRRSGRTVTVTNRGLRLDLPVAPFSNDASGSIFFAFLDCDVRREGSTATLVPSILLQRMSWDSDSDFVRIRPDILALSMMNHVVLPDEIPLKMGDGSGATSAPLAEPILRHIFVPHKCTKTPPPSGILFDPRLGEPVGLEIIPPLNRIKVISRSPTWQYFATPTSLNPDELYEINFNLVSVPDLDHLKEPMVFGVLELSIPRYEEQCCLVTGLEPADPNAFGTPALYFVPWCAFESRANVVDSTFEHVMDKTSRRGRQYFEFGKGLQLVASLGLDTKYSRLFYRLTLSITSAW
ncbi:hypothetical protein O9K51_00730 [Purpureocillium lavendulum]|uniref:Heterokaryon incompatibility domain-containing protein n=1 Tax=Purpureocillium lavendulum TaxID=1247861 RepID=A0AB34G3F6_9HYPO|nr:hypothetical protein O9K51_00730 [Purpureocillium lavendulum]